MALSMQQVYALQGIGAMQTGSHYADVIAAVLGPLVQGGASIYGTYADSEQNKKELKQREREFQAMLPAWERAQKQSALETVAEVRRAQIAGGYQAVYAPYILAAVVVGGLTLAAIAVSKGGKRGG